MSGGARVIIVADLTGRPRCETQEDMAAMVGTMRTPSGAFGLGDVAVYTDHDDLARDLRDGHERVGAPAVNAGADASKRLGLIEEVYSVVIGSGVTLYGETGGNLAYLLGAIARGTHVDLSRRSRLVTILRAAGFHESHDVWRYIDLYDLPAGVR